jgi:hypothetical protein
LGSGLSPALSPPSCLSSVCLLRLAPCLSPFLLCTFSMFTPSAVVLDYSLLFVFQVFFGEGDQSIQGLCWFILGVAVRILYDMWSSPVCSVECLTGRFGAGSSSCSGGAGSPTTVQRVEAARCK